MSVFLSQQQHPPPPHTHTHTPTRTDTQTHTNRQTHSSSLLGWRCFSLRFCFFHFFFSSVSFVLLYQRRVMWDSPDKCLLTEEREEKEGALLWCGRGAWLQWNPQPDEGKLLVILPMIHENKLKNLGVRGTQPNPTRTTGSQIDR